MNSEEKYFLIDGLQRVTTIEQFINGKYISDETQEIKEFKINLKNSEWYGETFSSLDENDKQNFLDYDLSLTVFEIPEKNESKNLNSMYEIFERINTGSEKLTAQEIRNAIYSGDLLNSLKEICSTSETFKALISNDKIYSKRKKDQELLLRFVCYYYVYTRFNSNTNLYVDNFAQAITTSKIETLNNFLYFSNLNNIDYKIYLNNVLEALEVVSSFCNNAFYSVSRDKYSISNKVQEVFAEALIIAVIINNYKINISKEKFDNIKLQIWKDENLYKKFTEKTTAKDAIIDRVNLMLGIIKDGRLL